MNLRLFATLAAILTLTGCALDPQSRQDHAKVSATMVVLQSAFNHASFDELRPVLAPDFRMYGLPASMSLDGLRVGMQSGAPRLVEVQILSIRRSPDGFNTRIGMYEAGRAAELKVGLTADGKIRSIENALWSGGLSSIHVPDSMTSRFVVCGGLMFVHGFANGKEGWFLVDSGSSGMLLNPKYFRAGDHGMLPEISSGVHGTGRPLGGVRVDDFRWEQMKAEGITAVLKDLSSLEGAGNTPLLGAIGHEQLKDCCMSVNWQKREIRICATNGSGARKLPQDAPPVARLSFDYYYHVPLLHVSIAGKDHPMMLDSGATLSLLPAMADIGGHFRPVAGQLKLSDGGAAQRVGALCGIVDEAKIGPAVLRNLPVVIYQVPYFGANGLLGVDFFKQTRVEINFRAREILFW